MKTTEPFALSDFVSCDETRPVLCKPWRHGDYVYATDGRVMVRTTAALFPEVTPNPDAANLQTTSDKLLSEPPPGEHWCSPTTEMREVKPIQCDKCVDGLQECAACGHNGECDTCDGTGFYVPRTSILVGETALNRFYVEKLCRLPGVMLHMPPNRDRLDTVPFRFDHGIGVLMPMRYRQ